MFRKLVAVTNGLHLTQSRINWTWPGRMHVIWRGREVYLYVTVWFFDKRYHHCRGYSNKK